MIDSQVRTCLVIVWMSLMGTGCARSARNPPAAESASPSEEVVTLLYDVRDLLLVSPRNYEVTYDEHGWPSATDGNDTVSTRDEAAQSLIDVFTDLIGAERASIHEEAGQLIVTQAPANHRKLERLIAQLREARSLQVTVQSYVIRGDKAGDQIARAAGNWHQAGDAAQLIYLTGHQMRTLLETRPVGVELLTAPRLTVFNGQRAHVIVASETPYVAGYEPVDFAFEGRQLEPVTKTVHSGVVIDCCPTVSSDRKYVTLTLMPRVSTLRDLTSAPWPGAPARRADLTVQVPHLTTAAVNVTVSVPDQGWVLVRTTPHYQPPDPGAPPAEPVLFAFGASVLEPWRE